jgi:thiol-disulfide isomerase/thioredoxin
VSFLTHRFSLRVAVVALALALLAYGVLVPGTRAVVAPPLPHAALQGGPLTVSELRGHPEAIVFYASWCGPCKTEAPAVAKFASSSAGRGRLLAIDYDDYGDIRGFLTRYHWTFPVLSDPSGETGDAYGVSAGLPTWVFLSPRGDIVSRISGPQSVAALRHDLAAAA